MPSPAGREVARKKHLQLIESLWSSGGMAQHYYYVLQPRRLSYSKFVKRVTAVVCQGIEEGWIELVLPKNPMRTDGEYDLRYLDPERFVEEIRRAVPEAD